MVCLRDRQRNSTPESVTEVMIEVMIEIETEVMTGTVGMATGAAGTMTEEMTGVMIVEMTKGMAGEDTNHHTHTHNLNRKGAIHDVYAPFFIVEIL